MVRIQQNTADSVAVSGFIRTDAAEQDNRGEIPRRYRRCVRQGEFRDESRSLGRLGKAENHRLRRESEDLRNGSTISCESWDVGGFCTRKNGRGV